MGQWQLTKHHDWYMKFNETDDDIPALNVTIRISPTPSRVEKLFEREACATPMQSAGLIGGAVTGAVIGSGFFPGVGTMVGGFMGFVGGAIVGLFSGAVIANSVCI